MYKLEVIVPKLNIRNTPVADPSFANWIGESLFGEAIQAIEKIEGSSHESSLDTIIDWYKDEHNKFYWAGGLQNINNESLNIDPTTNILNYNELLKDVPENWSKGGGKGVTVAILDNGFNINHKDIQNSVVETFNATDDSKNVQSNKDHGSNVSGLVAAKSNIANGIIGIAPFAKLVLIKVADNNGVIMPSYVKKGIDQALNNFNADIINLSLSLDIDDYMLERDAFLELFKIANQKKILLVASAGENSRLLSSRPNILFPANEEICISIGTIDATFLQKNPSPIFNNRLDFLIPNMSLMSTAGQSNNYTPIRDSSMAAAVLTAVASLFFSSAGSRIGKDEILNNLNKHFRLFSPSLSFSNLSIFKV